MSEIKKVSLAVAIIIALLTVGVFSVAKSYSGSAPKVVVEGNYIEAGNPQAAGQELSFGAIGSQLAEDYLPILKFNEGYYSGLPISLTGSDGDLTVSANGLVTFSGTNTINGTTTVLASYDGFVVYDDYTTSTGTAKAVFTNGTGVAMMCDAEGGAVDFNSTAFSPAVDIALGTSTGITAGATNLLSTTTVATTTDTVIALTYASPFKLAAGESILASFFNNSSGQFSSSTHLGNWDAEFSIPCRLMGN